MLSLALPYPALPYPTLPYLALPYPALLCRQGSVVIVNHVVVYKEPLINVSSSDVIPQAQAKRFHHAALSELKDFLCLIRL